MLVKLWGKVYIYIYIYNIGLDQICVNYENRGMTIYKGVVQMCERIKYIENADPGTGLKVYIFNIFIFNKCI